MKAISHWISTVQPLTRNQLPCQTYHPHKQQLLNWANLRGDHLEHSMTVRCWSIPYGVLSFPFLVWVRRTFTCIIPAIFLSEFELAPNIVITPLFYLNNDLSRFRSAWIRRSIQALLKRERSFDAFWSRTNKRRRHRGDRLQFHGQSCSVRLITERWRRASTSLWIFGFLVGCLPFEGVQIL